MAVGAIVLDNEASGGTAGDDGVAGGAVDTTELSVVDSNTVVSGRSIPDAVRFVRRGDADGCPDGLAAPGVVESPGGSTIVVALVPIVARVSTVSATGPLVG